MKGRLIFDERNDEVLRRRWRRFKIKTIGLSIFLAVIVLFVLVLFWHRSEQTDSLFVFLMLWSATFLGGLAIISLLVGLWRSPHTLVFENGVEFYGGLLSKRQFFRFESIEKVYARIDDNSGISMDYIVLILNKVAKKRHLVLGEGHFVDIEKLFELIESKVMVDFEPVREEELVRTLRKRGILGRFETLI